MKRKITEPLVRTALHDRLRDKEFELSVCGLVWSRCDWPLLVDAEDAEATKLFDSIYAGLIGRILEMLETEKQD